MPSTSTRRRRLVPSTRPRPGRSSTSTTRGSPAPRARARGNRLSTTPAFPEKGHMKSKAKARKNIVASADTLKKMTKQSARGQQKEDGDDRRDRTRKATKRSSTGEGIESPKKTTPKQDHTTHRVFKLSLKISKSKRVVKSSPQKASPRKLTKTKTPTGATPTKTTPTKTTPTKTKPKAKAAPSSKLKGRVGTAKVKKTAAKTGLLKKAKAGAKASVTTATRRAKKPQNRDKKKEKVTKTKKAVDAKETTQKGKRPVKHPNSSLTPNPDIVVSAKDPMFEVKNEIEIPEVSEYVNCKRAIRAVLTKDNTLLKKLIKNTKEIPSVFIKRCVSLQEDALDYAIKMDNTDALKLLIPELSYKKISVRKPMPHVLMENQDTGSYNFRSRGHAVRAINVGRGCREGNDAFTKDRDLYYVFSNDSINRLQRALTRGVPMETFLLLLSQLEYTCGEMIYLAVRAGQHKLAGQLVKRFNVGGGYGFNKLHEEVLLSTKPEQLSPFKGVSVIKKTTVNEKITPLHCAAINPNPKILAKLLSVMPDTSFPDKTGLVPIHYAAACEGSGPLELLLNRGVRADELQPKKLVTPLMIAAKHGRAQNIEVLLKNIKSAVVSDSDEKLKVKMGVDLKDKTGHYAIHYAAEGGHVDCVQSLVKHGAGVDTMESALNNKITPLMIAAERGHFQLAKVLIDELGAVIEKRDKIKRTSLMLACMNGHYPVATLLLRKGADPNAKDSSGNTPVHYAAGYGWWHCLKLLLKAGADPNILNDWKTPPLGIAYLKGHFGIADLLLKQPGMDVNYKDDSGATLLLTTCSHKMTEDTMKQLKYLIKKGADVIAVDINGKNALHFLTMLNPRSNADDKCKENEPDPLGLALGVIKLLLDKGCSPVTKDTSGNTPVSIALKNSNGVLLQALLVRGDRVSLDADENGDNPLHRMVRDCKVKDQAAIIRIIAEMEKKSSDDSTDMGAKVMTLEDAAKMKDKTGCTPFLRCVIDYGQYTSCDNVYNFMKALVEVCKSDINAFVDSDLKTAPPRAYAVHIFAALPTNTCKILPWFIALKPQLEVLNADGYTPLLCAIKAKQTETVKTLLSEGADPNGSEKFSKMALIHAVLQDLPAIIPDLIHKGAHVHGSRFKNQQPSIMHYIPAFIMDLPAKLRIAKELVSAGASLDAVDDEKRTVLHNAVNAVQSNVTTEFLEFLLDNKLDVFAVDNYGRLPLHYAFYKYNPFGEDSPLRGGQFDNQSSLDPIETVSLLAGVMNGKNFNIQDKYGRTPLHYAAYRGAMISAMHIAERIDDFDIPDEDGHTPLSMSILNRKESMAIWLIQKGANINRMLTLVDLARQSKDGTDQEVEAPSPTSYWTWKGVEAPSDPDPAIKTSLFQAIVHEDWQGAVYIMMDRITKFGISYPDAIEAVLAQHKFQLTNELIRKLRNPVKLQSTNEKAQNLLHLLAIHAVGGTDLEAQIATSLLDNGVKLFTVDNKGCTPLHYAAVNMNANICKIFAERDPVGFKSCITCADRKARVPVTSLFWGLSYKSHINEVISLIRKSNGSLDVCTPFPHVNHLTKKQVTRVESLEEWYHNLPDEKTTDVTPLIFMILMNNFEGCKLLLQNGASPNAKDRDGLTPLMHAVMQNEIVLVNVLMDHTYKPEKAGMRKLGQRPEISPWATNSWGQRKSGSYSSRTTVCIDDGYVKDEEQDQSKVHKIKKTSTLDLNAVDATGRTAIHYLMKTCDNGTYENVEMLQTLAGLGAKLSERDHQGKTPLDYTMATGSTKMAAALQKLRRVSPQKRVHCKPVPLIWSDGIDFPSPKPDVDGDAQAMIECLEAERSKTKQVEVFTPKVDARSGMKDEGVVVMDEEQNIGYDVIMTKVEVQYGHYGMNNFYKMQLIHQLGKDMIVLFTCWGRIGDMGQLQKTPFGTKEAALAEFKKIFKAKSGNDWANVKSFQKQPKKYTLVPSDPWRAKRNDALGDFKFDLESPVPSKLPEDMQKVIHELTKPQTLQKALKDTGIDMSIMNFSHLPKDVLHKANDVLDKISEKLKMEALERSQGPFDVNKQLAFKEEMCELSNEYFHLIPHKDFAHDVMKPITDARTLENYRKILNNLLELEVTNRILLGATYRKLEMHPLDYIYRALDCRLKLMDKDDTETQLLLQYIHYSSDGHPPKVQAIFRLSRDGEEKRLKSCKFDNHKLLWHGSSTVNLLSIMKQGLLVSPREAELTGSRFGQGIYTSDTFAKSIAYCTKAYGRQGSQFMLLCEVALGKMALANIDNREKKEFHSTYAAGRTQINGKRELLLPTGVSLPAGRLYTEQGYGYQSDYSEYVAHSEEQVCLRYLVQVI